MKAVAAMRNQFGGHAVHTDAPPTTTRHHVLAGQLTLRCGRARSPPHPARLPVVRRRRRGARAGRHVLRRPQRAGQDQPGRGGRLRRAALLAPGLERRAAGAVRRRPGGGPGRRGARRPAGAARDRDQPGPLQPGPDQQVAAAEGPRAARHGAHRAVLPRGPHPGEGRPVRPAPVPRRPAGAARAPLRRRPLRLRPGAQAAQLPAQDRRPRAARRPRQQPRRVRAGHPRGLGLPPRPHRRRAAGRPDRPGRGAGAAGRHRLRGGRPRRAARRRDDGLQAVLRAARDRRPLARPGGAGRGAARRGRAPPRRRDRPRASAWSGRTATSSR